MLVSGEGENHRECRSPTQPSPMISHMDDCYTFPFPDFHPTVFFLHYPQYEFSKLKSSFLNSE